MYEIKVDLYYGGSKVRNQISLKINNDEINSLLYYQGTTQNIRLNYNQERLRDFYHHNTAYTMMNTLLFPDFENEKIRFIEENRSVNLCLFDHFEELLKVYRNIYSAMCKYTFLQTKKQMYAYRQDRMAMLQYIYNGQIPSFISASLEKNIKLDFHDKKGCLLLNLEAEKNVIYIKMNEVLGELSGYPEEEEILFEPFLSVVSYKDLELSEEETCLRDIDGKQPARKLLLRVGKTSVGDRECNIKESDIMDSKYIENAKKVLKKLMRKQIPEVEEQVNYLYWKRLLQLYLKLEFQRIYNEIFKGNLKVEKLKETLLDDISKFKRDADKKRREYESQLKKIIIVLSIMNPFVAFFLALSFISGYENPMKILSLMVSTLCAILSGVCSSLSYQGKWKQRTTTYLRLDELERDIEYDMEVDMSHLKEYIERFKGIIVEDDRACEENTVSVLKHFNSIYISPDLKK